MKKLSKPVLAISLAITLLMTTAIVSFATDDGDPLGLCIKAPKYKSVQY